MFQAYNGNSSWQRDVSGYQYKYMYKDMYMNNVQVTNKLIKQSNAIYKSVYDLGNIG